MQTNVTIQKSMPSDTEFRFVELGFPLELTVPSEDGLEAPFASARLHVCLFGEQQINALCYLYHQPESTAPKP